MVLFFWTKADADSLESFIVPLELFFLGESGRLSIGITCYVAEIVFVSIGSWCLLYSVRWVTYGIKDPP